LVNVGVVLIETAFGNVDVGFLYCEESGVAKGWSDGPALIIEKKRRIMS
jgi:hypothetical protein